MLYTINKNIPYFLESCTKFYIKTTPVTLWRVLTSEVFNFSPFLQLGPILCLCYILLKRHPEAAKGSLLLLETVAALRAPTALSAPAQPPPGLPPPSPQPGPHGSPQSRREAEESWQKWEHVPQRAQDRKKIFPRKGRETEKQTLD